MSTNSVDAPFGLLRLNEKRRVVEGDANFERIFRATLDEVRNKQLSELASPKDRRGLRMLDRAITSGGEDARVDVMLTLRFKSGDFLTRVRAQRDDEGWWVWLEDVLDQPNNLIHSMQVGQAQWSAVHARSDEGIAIISADDELREFNDRFFELTAFESGHGVRLNEEALQGQNIFDFFGDETYQPLREAAGQARTRKKLRFEAVVRHRDLFLDLKLSPIHLPVKGYAGWCLTVRDVTHQELLKQLTEQVQKKNADTTAMLGNLRQGICTIMPGLVIHPEYSRHLEAMLGTDQIANQALSELVFADAHFGADTLHQVLSVIEICLACDMLTFELNEHLLVREFERETKGVRRIFEADWVPLVGVSGRVERLMLTLREVTEIRELQAQTHDQRRELTMVGQLIRTAPEDYTTTVINMNRLLDEAERALTEGQAPAESNEPDGQDARIQLLFRLMHTVKGDARSYGWSQIADAAHDAEDGYDKLRDDTLSWDAPRLQKDIAEVRSVLGRYTHTWETTLARSSSGSGILAVSPRWVDEMLELISISDAQVAAARAQLLTLGYPRLETICETPYKAMADSATACGKSVPKLVIKDHGVRSSAAIAQPLRQILNHLMINSLDHGVESDETREAQGKPVPAVFHLEAQSLPDTVNVRFWDDGRGLDEAKLRQAHPNATDDELLEHIFASGTSTFSTVSKTSGRGVGLDAVRQVAVAHGGSARAEFLETSPGSAERPIVFVVDLPKRFFNSAN